MSLDNSAVVPALPTGGYQIEQSLRFDLSSEAHLSRSMTSTGNRKTWTWSAWVKLSTAQSGNSYPTYFDFASSSSSNTRTKLYIDANQRIGFQFYDGTNNYYATFEPLFRDYSAWYHFVVRCDSTQSTASDRLRFYLNGEEVSKSAEGAMPQNHDTYANLSGYTAMVGNSVNDGGYQRDFGGYMAEVHHIDGQSLDPTYFGETGDYGEWKPIEYTGSYGTNGFYLPFEEGSGGLYEQDRSGNGNNFTAVNMLQAVDVVLDSPTNNFATLNPLWQNDYGTYKEGNLDFEGPFNHHTPSATSIPMASGKWYMEFRAISGTKLSFGVLSNLIRYRKSGTTNYIPGEHTTQDYTGDACVWYYDRIEHNATIINYPFSSHILTSPNVYMIAFDSDTGKVWFGKEGEWNNNGSVSSTLNTSSPDVTMSVKAGDSFSFHATAETSRWKVNCGQDSSFSGSETAQGNTDENGYGDFTYTPPSGFLALCTANLPDPAVIPSEHFNTVLYTGTSTTNSVTGVGFQPDFVWIKDRSTANSYAMFDVIRGTSAAGTTNTAIGSNRTDAEGNGNGVLSSFNTDGFTVDDGSSGSYPDSLVNDSPDAYVAWNWKANGSGSSNTNGSITSTVSANQDAGFSIVSWSGSGSTGSVGHGLSKKLEFYTIKNRTTVSSWWSKYSEIDTDANKYKYIDLNEYNATGTAGSHYSYSDSSKIYVNNGQNVNGSGQNLIAYCFHSVDGFSKFGSYVGNSSADGVFVYTGFRPAFIMVKSVTNSAREWYMFDNARDPDNSTHQYLRANVSNAEGTASNDNFDFVSNGFKIRVNDTYCNSSSETYIYMCFAEHPFKYTNAR